MPGLDLNAQILSASASANAGDWATAEAGASFDVEVAAELDRGFELGGGAEAGVHVDASVSKFISAGAGGEAHASARVKAQVQVPMDLFDECGLAVRLEAIAEAAAAVNLRIGLSIGDFLDLAGEDLRIKGVPLKLLRVLLEETDIQGGVQAKAAVAAMAYANVTITGRLIASGGMQPGFSIAAGAGVGWLAGAGYKVYAQLGVRNPRRLVGRTVDLSVDATCDAILESASEELRPVIDELRTPAKIAFRTAFELGLALTENGGAFSASDGEKMALRCVQVALEEVQRFILERATQLALDQLLFGLRNTPLTETRWRASRDERRSLADLLRNAPQEPFALDQPTLDYWMSVIAGAAEVAEELNASGEPSDEVGDACALIWSCVQLLGISVERISVASARASVIGMAPAVATSAFEGDLSVPPPLVKRRINAALGRSASAAVGQVHVVEFLTRTAALDGLAQSCPAAVRIVRMVTGSAASSFPEALRIVFENIGSFVPNASGNLSARATLAMIRDAMNTFIEERIRQTIRPALDPLFTDKPDLRLYMDEVLISTMRYGTGTLLTAVLDWNNADATGQKVLRETCSAVLMRLFGRSLVVTGDVLLAHAMDTLSDGFTYVAENVNNRNGVAQVLANSTGWPRDKVADVMEETMYIGAMTFTPMSAARRRRMRELMYRVIDTAPPEPSTDLLVQLRDALMVPNAEAILELAVFMGQEIALRVVLFIEAALVRLALWILEQLKALIEFFQQAVEAWVRGLRHLVRFIARQLVQLVEAIAELLDRIRTAALRLAERTEAMLRLFAHGSNSDIKSAMEDYVKGVARGLLYSIPGFGSLPWEARSAARGFVNDRVDDIFESDFLDPVIDVFQHLAEYTADFLADVRALEDEEDIALAILDLFLDRLEDAVHAVFGKDPNFNVKFGGWPLEVNFDVHIPLDELTSILRGAASTVDAVIDAARELAEDIYEQIEAAADMQDEQDEHDQLKAQKERKEATLTTVDLTGLEIIVVSPTMGSVREGYVMLEVFIKRAPIAILGRQPDEHQRFGIWLNQHEVLLDDADVQVFPYVATQMEGAVAVAAQTELANVPATIRDAEIRASAMAAQARSGPAEVVRTSTGKAEQFGGFVPGAILRKAKKKPQRYRHMEGGLSIRIQLPTGFLVEGLNALAFALVPGASAQRIEKSVSFLFVPKPKRAPGTRLRPPPHGWDTAKLHPAVVRAIEEGLGKRGFGKATQVLMAPATGGKPLVLFPPKAARNAALKQSTKALKARSKEPLKHLEVLTKAVDKRSFRPVALKAVVVKRAELVVVKPAQRAKPKTVRSTARRARVAKAAAPKNKVAPLKNTKKR